MSGTANRKSKVVETSARTVADCNVFEARAAYGELERWVMTEAMKLPEADVEVKLEQRGREVYRLLLQAHLHQRGTGDVGKEIEVVAAEDGAKQIHQAGAVNPCKITSVFGEVVAQRQSYGMEGTDSVHPLDEELQLPERSFSYVMQRRVVEETIRGPFDEATESIQKNTGVGVPKRSAEQIVMECAQDFDAFYATRQAPSAKQTGPILVATADCKGVPMVKPGGAKHVLRLSKGEKRNKKKMATVAAVFTQQPRYRTPQQVVDSLFEDKPKKSKRRDKKPEHKRVWASLAKSKDEVLQEVAAEVLARDPETKKTLVGVTDGERGLQMRMKKFLSALLLILDFLHVLEKLWQVAHALYGEATDAAEAWVREHALMILQGKVSAVVRGIRQSMTKRKLVGAKRKTLRGVAKYFYRNRKYMKYNEYLQKGYPIASGAVEGACKNLVKDRMERSGMRWRIPGAEAVLKLRAIKLSGDLDAYWRFHIRQDQRRLYGSRRWKVAA